MTNPLTNCIEKLCETLGDSAAFRTWTATATADDAKGRVHYYEADESEAAQALLPRCVLADFATERRKLFDEDEAEFFAASGQLLALFEAEVSLADAAEDPSGAQMFAFNASLGLVLLDLEKAAAREQFQIVRVSLPDPAEALPRTTRGPDGSRRVGIMRIAQIDWRAD